MRDVERTPRWGDGLVIFAFAFTLLRAGEWPIVLGALVLGTAINLAALYHQRRERRRRQQARPLDLR